MINKGRNSAVKSFLLGTYFLNEALRGPTSYLKPKRRDFRSNMLDIIMNESFIKEMLLRLEGFTPLLEGFTHILEGFPHN